MVTGDAVSEAVSIARDDPELAVGLHLTLSNGRSSLPPEVIPALLSRDSVFLKSPAIAGFKYYVDPRAREQLELEIEAQFEAFLETGLPLSHVDGHQHLHAHPSVLPIVVELALRYGAHGIRVPIDPIQANLRADKSRLISKISIMLCHAYLANTCRRLLIHTSLSWCEVSIGGLMSGHMNPDYVIKMLQSLDCRRIEIYFHPSLTTLDRYGPNPGDLQTLLDNRLIEFLKSGDYNLTNYAGISREKDGRDDCI
jgi:hopanoid biosynthesis associated protein HpnK